MYFERFKETFDRLKKNASKDSVTNRYNYSSVNSMAFTNK